MKAIRRQAGIAKGIGQAAESADEAVDVMQLLERLELGLTEALGLVARSERDGAMMAVNAVLEFVASVPGWEGRDLGNPLWQLLTALKDLDFGRVGSMLAPNPAVRNRKPDAGMRKIVKAYALLCVDILCRSGWSVKDGCKIVANTLQANGFPLGGRTESPSWKSVNGWRDRFTKLAKDDQTRTTFEGLKPHIDLLGRFTKEEARDWVKGQIWEVLSKMGSGASE